MSGISCISPWAPFGETASGSKADSTAMSALTGRGGEIGEPDDAVGIDIPEDFAPACGRADADHPEHHHANQPAAGICAQWVWAQFRESLRALVFALARRRSLARFSICRTRS